MNKDSSPAVLNNGNLKGWNVVLITIDAVDPAKLGCYGGNKNTTPYLDKLAKEGVLVDRAYCTTGSTCPSHASMFTSLNPEGHGCSFNGRSINKGLWHFPMALKEEGYDTLGCTISFIMDSSRNFSKGFKYYYSLPTPTPDDYIRSNKTSVKLFKKFFSSVSVKSPFFAWVHIKGGHSPLVPIEKKYLQQVSCSGDPENLPCEGVQCLADDGEGLKTLSLYYEANLSEMDDGIKEIVEFISSKKYSNNTLFMIVADHGETFDHGIVGEHWPSPYESTMRIPFILWSENLHFPDKKIKDRLVMTTDIGPTLLSLLGFEHKIPANIDGVNFLAPTNKRTEFHGASVSVYDLEQQISAWNGYRILDPNGAESQKRLASIKNRVDKGLLFYAYYNYNVPDNILWKLIYMPVMPGSTFVGNYENFQLYDVIKDRSESLNVIGLESSDVKYGMMSDLVRRKASISYFNNNFLGFIEDDTSKQVDYPVTGLDAKTLESLRSLGYVK